MSDRFITKAVVNIRIVYTCVLCGKKELGDDISVEISHCPVVNLMDAINNHPQTSGAMPVGWSYKGVFSCQCKHIKEEENNG